MATKNELLKEALEELHELEKLLDERIVDFYEVKGMVQARHAYIFYRKYVYTVQNLLRDSIRKKEDENQNKS